MRADQSLVARGLAPTRSAAQRLIGRGAVQWEGPSGWSVVRKAGEDVPDGAALRVTDEAELRYVSRAGLKLEAALAHTGLDVRGRVCLDLGQSTGGFTDCLLRHGAARVVGVDVGHGQVHASVRQDARVVVFEHVHARDLTPAMLGASMPPGGFDLIVADLSFISLTKVLPAWPALLAPQGEALALVKPQFEVGSNHVGKGGIVRDAAARTRVRPAIEAAFEALGWSVRDWFDSAVPGGDGNREYFVRAGPCCPGDASGQITQGVA